MSMYLRVLWRAKYVNTSDYDGQTHTCACVFDVIVACGTHHSYFSIWRSEGLGEDTIGAAVFGCYECGARMHAISFAPRYARMHTNTYTHALALRAVGTIVLLAFGRCDVYCLDVRKIVCSLL